MKFKDALELFKNKRYRALVILMLYIIFFIILASMFKGVNNNVDVKPSTPVEEKSPLELYCEMANYEFKMVYTSDEIYELTGKTFRDDSYFKINDIEYYYKDSNYYLLSDTSNSIDLDFDYYNVNKICSLISEGKIVNKNENLESNTIENKYLVNDTNKNIYITTIIKDNDISNVLVDLSDEDKEYIISIEYFNKNKVSNFTSIFNEAKAKEKSDEENIKEVENIKEGVGE